jgi:hypothetical protein
MKRPAEIQAWMDRVEALPRDKMFALAEFDLLDYLLDLEARNAALEAHNEQLEQEYAALLTEWHLSQRKER